MQFGKSKTEVNSSQITSIAWDSDELTVEFNSGKVYKYFHVSAQTYIDLITSDSVGKEFNHLIKKEGYEFELVDTSTPEVTE